MRLNDFILANREQILLEWESFALTCSPASNTMDVEALRDHAAEMLGVIAADLATWQNEAERDEKAKGQAPEPAGGETPATEHGAGRAESGFTVEQMVAEFRALRASVLRLWTHECGELKPADIEDMIRFNEAIDQSLAESVAEFHEQVENAKEMFIAILGHDLRTPLGAIHTAASFMRDTGDLQDPHQAMTSRIADISSRATEMVGELLDFTRSRLGGGIPIERAEVDLRAVVDEVIADITVGNPQWTVRVDGGAEQIGQWDRARVSQAFTNLLVNAFEHGSRDTAVEVVLGGDEDVVVVTIRNDGAPIPADRLDGIFYPMKVKTSPQGALARGPTGNLGLGLYIAERIVYAHRGKIEVESSEARGTTFTVHLPRGD